MPLPLLQYCSISQYCNAIVNDAFFLISCILVINYISNKGQYFLMFENNLL